MTRETSLRGSGRQGTRSAEIPRHLVTGDVSGSARLRAHPARQVIDAAEGLRDLAGDDVSTDAIEVHPVGGSHLGHLAARPVMHSV